MSEYEGYEGVTHAGLAIVARDTGLVLLAQRAYDETDDDDVAETWEFPGGGLEDGEDPQAAAFREYEEEVGVILPPGEIVNGWRSGPEDNYQGFVYVIDTAMDLTSFEANDEVQDVAFVPPRYPRDLVLRPEMRDFDWTLLDVSGNEAEMTEIAAAQVGTDEEYTRVDESGEPIGTAVVMEGEAEPELTRLALVPGTVYVHGIIAPEGAESGDARGFNAGALTRRPLHLPFAWQKFSAAAHDKSVVVGSIDRMMRKEGNIHWEGRLLDTAEADEFTGLVAHFGRYGISLDGDRGDLDAEVSAQRNGTWFAGARIAGATGVSIPAFAEAYVALGPHPDMPEEFDPDSEVLTAGARVAFDRGPGWVTNPKETKRLHDYWTKKGQPGYAKIGWGTPGDFRRARALIGEKIGKNSPEDMKYLNQIIAQWHHDALGYWPGELDKPGNKTSAQAKAEREARKVGAALEEPKWEAVLVSSAGARVLPPASYFERHPDSGALVIEEPDSSGIRRTYGYAGEWGVCHVGYDGKCVEVPEDRTDTGYAEYHLGYTRTADGQNLPTGLITYKVNHRDARTLLSQSAEQAHYDNIENAWAAVRLGEDERGVWFSGVVLPHVPEEDIVLIEASGQVSGEWKYGALRGLQCVNIPGFPVMRSSAAYDDEGNVVALVAAAHDTSECPPDPADRFAALKAAFEESEVEAARVRFDALRATWARREGGV